MKKICTIFISVLLVIFTLSVVKVNNEKATYANPVKNCGLSISNEYIEARPAEKSIGATATARCSGVMFDCETLVVTLTAKNIVTGAIYTKPALTYSLNCAQSKLIAKYCDALVPNATYECVFKCVGDPSGKVYTQKVQNIYLPE